jgi:hypothetical protein
MPGIVAQPGRFRYLCSDAVSLYRPFHALDRLVMRMPVLASQRGCSLILRQSNRPSC